MKKWTILDQILFCKADEGSNSKKAKINWQFKAEDARIKLKRLYPHISN